MKELYEIFRKNNIIISIKKLKKKKTNFRLDKTIWQDRLNEMSWRDGFTEQMFTCFQLIIDFICTQLQNKKTTKKNIDEV